ncbi:MAG: D-amino-acid transaminase [Clostridia bacterium]|nr:D-amino-acid transaminase [Clostridia bacterium]
MNGIAYVNGKFVSLDEAYVHVEDRGHQFGDGVYEVVYAFNGVPFGLEEHMNRFFNSMAMIRINPSYTKEEVTALIQEALKRSGFEHAQIYYHMTRGTSKRSHPFPGNDVPGNLVITVRQAVPLADELGEKGVVAHLVEDIRWGRCNIKSLNLLPNVLAKQEALDRGAFEAILCKDGYITEGSVSNCFIVANGKVQTHQADNRILPGITRMHVIQLCHELGIEVREIPFTPQELYEAEEAFFTGSGIEVLPIIRVDEHVINQGRVGPISAQLRKAYKKLIADRCNVGE